MPRRRYIGRGVDVVMHREELALDQVGLARRASDGDVGLAHGEVELAIVEHQVDLDLGIELDELPEPRRQPDRAEAEVAVTLSWPVGWSLLSASCASASELGEDLVRGAVEQLALLGQDQAAGVAVEQRHVEALLERADLAADRGLAEGSSVSPAWVKLPASATA